MSLTNAPFLLADNIRAEESESERDALEGYQSVPNVLLHEGRSASQVCSCATVEWNPA